MNHQLQEGAEQNGQNNLMEPVAGGGAHRAHPRLGLFTPERPLVEMLSPGQVFRSMGVKRAMVIAVLSR